MSRFDGAFVAGNFNAGLDVSHDGRQIARAAVGFSPLVPNWFLTISDDGRLNPVALTFQHARWAAAFVIGEITEWLPDTTV